MGYYDTHKVEKHTYYEGNKELYKKRYAGYRETYLAKITCECGCKVSRMNLYQHKRSNKHKKKLAKLTSNNLQLPPKINQVSIPSL